MSRVVAIGAGVLLLALLLLFSMTYTVRFHEVAIKTRFAQTSQTQVVTEPGLNFKLPFFADRVVKLDTRLQLLQSPLDTIATRDEQQLLVQTFLLWRVDREGEGPMRFFQNYGTPEQARTQLTAQLRDRMSVLGRSSFDELIGGGNRLKEAEAALLAAMKQAALPGVALEAVGINQISLPSRTTTAVLGRMEQTRRVLAEAERAAGQSEAARVQAETKSKLDKIRAVVRRRAEEIRAQGEVKATQYYQQMAQAEEFAVFLIQLEALKDMLSEYTTLILPDTVAPWHLLNLRSPVDASGLPVAPGDLSPEALAPSGVKQGS